MKTIINYIIIALLFIYLSDIEITWKPFKIQLNGWRRLLGWGFMISSILMLSYENSKEDYFKGYKKGMDRGWDEALDHIRKKTDILIEKHELNKCKGIEVIDPEIIKTKTA